MLEERSNVLAIGLLHAYLKFMLPRRFQSVRVDGFESFESFLNNPTNTPLIFYGNHRGWWDGFFIFLLARRYVIETRVIMEEKNLRLYPYFRYTGAFGVDLDKPRSRARSFLHAVRFLKNGKGRRALLIYPHGRLVSPLEKGWPPFQPGLEALLRLCPDAQAVPVVHEIVPGKHPKPEAFIEIGEPVSAVRNPTIQDLEKALAQTREKMLEKALGEPGPMSFSLR